MKNNIINLEQKQGRDYVPQIPVTTGRSRVKILIADDSNIDMSHLVNMLSSYNYEIIEARNGAEAIAQFEKEVPDLILMDLYMPVMDGHEATRIIKAMSDGLNIYVPIIFLTARDNESVLIESLECGGDDFLVKPFNTGILKAKIEVMLRNKEMHDTVIKQKKELERAQQFYRQDIEIAETIIRNISRSKYLDIGNIKYLVTPVEILSGDLILCAVTPSKGQVFLVADFTGHGLGAAIGSMIVADAFYAMVFKGYPIDDIVFELNHKLNKTLPTGRFMAACLIELHPGQRNISVFNAGLPDILIRSNRGEIRERISSLHLPLGVVPNEKQEIKIQYYEVDDGESIYVFSDGLIETQNEKHEHFGIERLERCISDKSNEDHVFESILDEVKDYMGDNKQIDDISLLEINCRDSFIEDNKYWSDEHKHRQPMLWEFSFKLGTDLIKELNPLPMIVQLLTDMQGINNHRQSLHTIFSELYLNSLEHGILGLDKNIKLSDNGFTEYYMQREKLLNQLDHGEIEIHVTHEPEEDGGKFKIRITDSGVGFDFEKLLPEHDNEKGIGLIKSLCDKVEYREKGNVVEVEFNWKKNGN